MNAARNILTLAIVGIVVGTAVADWDTTMPEKWVQLPDLEPYSGMDVNATSPKILADDFECREFGPITEIHIWGSWKNDLLPFGDGVSPLAGDPLAVDFRLSIHEDIPADLVNGTHSMPLNPPLWEEWILPGMFSARPWAENLTEGWYDPNTGEYDEFGDTVCWQYNFKLEDAGVPVPWQEGSPDNPVVYWLDVEAVPHDPEARFGWKTSIDQWNDDAVWTDGPLGAAGWNELRHPLEPDRSLDLAFVIVPEPATMSLLGLSALTALIRRRRH